MPKKKNAKRVFEPYPIDTVTIVGMGTSCYDWIRSNYLDFQDDGEVWTFNIGAAIFRHDVVWDMHTPKWLEDRKIDKALKRREWMKDHDRPIVMPRVLAEIPNSYTYPLRQVIERTNSNYFGSGIAYALAFAYVCGVKTLRLFGCDLSYARDYNTHSEQGRACAEYWIGRLKEKGVIIEVTPNTHFLDMHSRCKGLLYGYDERMQWEFPAEGGMGTFIGPDYADNGPLPAIKPKPSRKSGVLGKRRSVVRKSGNGPIRTTARTNGSGLRLREVSPESTESQEV